MIYRLNEDFEYNYENDPFKKRDVDHSGYWYKTRHGVQPGTIPKGVVVLDTIDEDNWTYVELDTALMHGDEVKYELYPTVPPRHINEAYEFDDEDDFDFNEDSEYDDDYYDIFDPSENWKAGDAPWDAPGMSIHDFFESKSRSSKRFVKESVDENTKEIVLVDSDGERYILSNNTFMNRFELTSEENFNSRIMNERTINKFSYRDGFTSFDDVIDYINKYFHSHFEIMTESRSRRKSSKRFVKESVDEDIINSSLGSSMSELFNESKSRKFRKISSIKESVNENEDSFNEIRIADNDGKKFIIRDNVKKDRYELLANEKADNWYGDNINSILKFDKSIGLNSFDDVINYLNNYFGKKYTEFISQKERNRRNNK